MPLAVARGDLVLLVLVQAEQDEAPPGAQDASAFAEGACRVLGVGQGVKHQHGIERCAFEGQSMDIGNLCRRLREAAQPRPLPEADALNLRAQVSAAAAGLELALRQARSLCEAAFAATPEVVAELGLDAKLKRRAPRAEPAKVSAN